MTTASEKLREMSRFEGENHWREQIDERLAAALPQIVALVEAAATLTEDTPCANVDVGWGPCYDDMDSFDRIACSRCRAHRALAALDEALS